VEVKTELAGRLNTLIGGKVGFVNHTNVAAAAAVAGDAGDDTAGNIGGDTVTHNDGVVVGGGGGYGALKGTVAVTDADVAKIARVSGADAAAVLRCLDRYHTAGFLFPNATALAAAVAADVRHGNAGVEELAAFLQGGGATFETVRERRRAAAAVGEMQVRLAANDY
jgi:hypothetical protein